MELKYQVCTLEQAKEFDKQGVKLESYFVWMEIDKEKKKWILTTNHTYLKSEDFCEYSAYSCAELGVLLPENIILNEKTSYFKIDRQINCFKFFYKLQVSLGFTIVSGMIKEYEAHAKADLLIHLLKKKIVKPEDLSWED